MNRFFDVRFVEMCGGGEKRTQKKQIFFVCALSAIRNSLSFIVTVDESGQRIADSER